MSPHPISVRLIWCWRELDSTGTSWKVQVLEESVGWSIGNHMAGSRPSRLLVSFSASRVVVHHSCQHHMAAEGKATTVDSSAGRLCIAWTGLDLTRGHTMWLLFNVITHGFEVWSPPPHDEDFTRGLLFQEPFQY